ncbi:uncharacterized protein PAE49_020691 [Odontesthes bonariensis]|uniref:uncharacterized protein LOC142367136 n=1 Tax=Odontesthes bonariensis TaxID=219752 RepID=UPI003F5859B8
MKQIEELRVFVSERLNAATSEILDAFAKTVANYEEEASRLKEENERHRSLLDIILKPKSAPTKAFEATKSLTAAIAGAAPSTLDPRPKSKARETTVTFTTGLQTVFTAPDEFLKFATGGGCRFCLKEVQATEAHLMKRHYLSAVHFIHDFTAKFVIPCMCKDKIQNRSHWHCSCCKKIIYRRCNFEAHLSKQHGLAILQPSQDAETHRPLVSVVEEGEPPIPEPWCQDLGSLEQQEAASWQLQVKEEANQERHPQKQHAQRLLIQNGNNEMGEQSLEPNRTQDSALNIVLIGNCVQEVSESSSMQIGKGDLLPNSSIQTMDTQPETKATEISDSAGENQHSTGNGAVAETGSCSKIEESKKAPNYRSGPTRNQGVKRSLPGQTDRRTPAGSYHCKACRKSFHYMYTLRTHVLTHAQNKICICGICGQRLGYRESLVKHVQRHTRRNRCGTCGKEFSSDSRLKRHKKFHLPKGLNAMSSA